MTTKLAFNQIGNSSVNLGDSATGDGVTDETSLVQAALDSGAKEVIVPHGKIFLCTSTVTRPADVVIKGTGTIRFNLTVAYDYGLYITTDGGGIEGVKFENVSAVGNTETIRFEDVNNVFFRHNIIEGGHYGLSVQNVAGVYTVNQDLDISHNYVTGQIASGFDLAQISNSVVIGNNADTVGRYVPPSNYDGDGFKFRQICKDLTIMGNTARTCFRDGFDFYDGLINSTVIGNVADNNNLNGFELKGDIAVTDYVFRDNSFIGNIAKGNDNFGFQLQSMRATAFSGNVAYQNTEGGWLLNDVQECTFASDKATANFKHGFDIRIASRCTFSGCMAVDNSYVDGTTQNGTYHGFEVLAAADSLDFTGCRALNGTTTGVKGGQGYGINFATGAADNRVIGGRFEDNVTGDFGGATSTNNFATFSAGINDFEIRPAGVTSFGTHTAIGAETVTGYITIKDEGGTSRKIAVVS